MICPKCKSNNFKRNGWLNGAKQRFKCNDCGKRFCETTSTLWHRHRLPAQIIRVSVFFHLFIPARTVQVFIQFLFGCHISKDTVCSWTKKFLKQMPEIKPMIKEDYGIKIRHTDEKQFKIRGEKAWWWNTTDHQGNGLTSSVSFDRSLVSAKNHIKKHKLVESKIDIMVTDKLQSYIKSIHLFGRKCNHVKRGLAEMPIQCNGRLLYLSNLQVERLHSKIDHYINTKFRGSFTNIKSADMWRKAFMFTDCLQRSFALHKSFETYPMPANWSIFNEGVSVSATRTV